MAVAVDEGSTSIPSRHVGVPAFWVACGRFGATAIVWRLGVSQRGKDGSALVRILFEQVSLSTLLLTLLPRSTVDRIQQMFRAARKPRRAWTINTSAPCSQGTTLGGCGNWAGLGRLMTFLCRFYRGGALGSGCYRRRLLLLGGRRLIDNDNGWIPSVQVRHGGVCGALLREVDRCRRRRIGTTTPTALRHFGAVGRPGQRDVII